jgi:hypothetical protein
MLNLDEYFRAYASSGFAWKYLILESNGLQSGMGNAVHNNPKVLVLCSVIRPI